MRLDTLHKETAIKALTFGRAPKRNKPLKNKTNFPRNFQGTFCKQQFYRHFKHKTNNKRCCISKFCLIFYKRICVFMLSKLRPQIQVNIYFWRVSNNEAIIVFVEQKREKYCNQETFNKRKIVIRQMFEKTIEINGLRTQILEFHWSYIMEGTIL